MHQFSPNFSFFVLLFCLSCSQQPIEQAEGRQLLDEYSTALSSKSAEKIARIFHEEAMVLPEGKDIAMGQMEIQAHFKGLESIDFEETFSIEEWIPANDLVIVRTLNTGKWSALDNSDNGSFSVKGQMVLKRDTKGELKIFRYMYNSNPVAQKITNRPIDGGFAHVVYFWLKRPDDQEVRDQFIASLSNFIDHSEFVRSSHIGTPAATDREVIDNSYTYCLIVTFDSKEDQDKYQAEPGHLQFIDESKALWDRVQVYDSEDIM